MKRNARYSTHTATFVTERGHVWEIDYCMEGREVSSVNWVRVDGTTYAVKTVARETAILNAVQERIDLVEWGCDDLAERETHHMCD